MEMKLEDVCDTGLALGLSIGGAAVTTADSYQRQQEPKPSLTLSLSDDVYGAAAPPTIAPARPSSPSSAVSSFSGVKKERGIGGAGEEPEVEKVSSRASDEDDDGSARKKLRLTKEQSALLEDRFKEHSTLNPKQKQALAKQLNLRPRQVEVWFQNRRARTKLKQTEVDCEFLKRCCERLTEENRRLHKELQELKAIKFAPPLYMQFPAAAIAAMCPSCDRIGGGGGAKDGASKGKGGGATGSQSGSFNPFAHSARC